jgi:gliding motility-associated-like protein
MVQNYSSFSRIFKIAAIALFLVLGFTQDAKACHGTPLLGVTFTPTATGIDIDGQSDGATCGCGPYFMQAEVAFTAACFTGNSPVCGDPSWGLFPWYESGLNVPGYGPPLYTENCVTEPYFTLTIPFADLCPGATYVVRVREMVCGSGSPGPWSIIYTFTTPGTATPVVVTTTADRYDACPGDTVNFTASATGGCSASLFNYSWSPATGLSNPNIPNPQLVVQNANTIYTLTVTGQCGNPFTATDDTIGINVGPAPTPGTASALPASICSGGSSTVTVSGQDPSSLIQWQVSPNGVTWFNLPGANNASYNTGPLSSSLYYQAIITGSGWFPGSGCGSTISAPVLVTVNPSPSANAGANTTVCAGSCTTLTGTGGTSYNWQPGNLNGASVSVCPTSPTVYTLTVTDANGCTATDNVTVSTSTAAVTGSPDVNICPGNSTVLFASGPNGNTYAWTPNGTLTGASTANPTATPLVTTTYTVTATNTLGCTATDSITVTITPSPPLTVSNDTSMCAGGSAVLNVSGATTYSWQPGPQSGSSITVSPSTTTTYTVTGNTNNCLSVDSITVTINPPPYVFAGPDFDVCSGSQATMTVATTGNAYTWTPTTGIVGSNTTQSVIIAPTTNTSYTVTVSGPGGCISTDTINVSVNPVPNVTASSPDNTICAGQQSTSVTGSGASTYSWIPTTGLSSPTAGTSTANPSTTTTYQVIGTDANGCMDTASITITVNPLPGVYITSTPTECGDSTGTFVNNGSVSGTAPFTFTINSTQYTTLPTNMQAGTYTIVTTDANGCYSSQVVPVGMVNNSSVTANANPTFGTYPLPVSFTGSGSSGITNWYWDFVDGPGSNASTQSSSWTFTAPGTYTVVLTGWNDDYGCAVTSSIVIEVVEEAAVALTNVFTPNADGVNDGFTAKVSGVKEVKVKIFNRWGTEVFEGGQSGLPGAPHTLQLWDGKTNSGSLPDDGTYYYVISAVGYDTKSYEYSGFVQLLKHKP